MSHNTAADSLIMRALFLDEAEGHLQAMREAYGSLCGAAAASDYRPGPELDRLFRALHTMKGAAGSVGHDGIATAAHEMEDLCAELRSGTLHPTPGILETLREDLRALGAMLEGARHASARLAKRDNVELPSPLVDRRTQRPPPGDVVERRSEDRSVRIGSQQLDDLMDGVGDMVILRTRIDRRISELEGLHRDLRRNRTSMRRAMMALGSYEAAVATASASSPGNEEALARLADVETELTSALSHLERATQGLITESEGLRRNTQVMERSVRHARLQRIEGTYHRLAAALRETAKDAGKNVQLVTSGSDLELDKSTLEQLYDSLLHMIRNALAHGIETPAERTRQGKPETARIEITARLEGGFVFITFGDDGQGVDDKAVKEALIRLGKLTADATPTHDELMDSLFEPGLSTREEVDTMAGRGFGLDVVRNTALQLGGDVTCTSTPGKGTLFRFSFPLVTAISDALLFKVGGQVYAIPAGHVVEALAPAGSETAPVQIDNHTLRLPSGAELPIVRLQTLLGVETPPDHRTAALHIRYGERSFVLICDRLIGTRTIVVRPLGPVLGLLPLYSGITISGAGKAQLVLDLSALVNIAEKRHRGPSAGLRPGPPRILVADDSRLARDTAARALAAAGLSVVTAEDGWEAWDLLNERRFDLLVTDLEMPRIDGFQLLGQIRHEATLRGLPIIVVTARTGRAVRERARRLGADTVLSKSPNRRALVQAVRDLLTQRRSDSGAA